MAQADKQAQIQRIMDNLNVDEQQAREMLEFDLQVDRMSMGELKQEMGADHWQVIKEMSKTGSRKTKTEQETDKKAKKTPTVYNFDKKTKKADTEKENFVQNLAEMLEKEVESVENVEIVNKNRQISFNIGQNHYSLTLTKHRKQSTPLIL